jgi:hypothetical protein
MICFFQMLAGYQLKIVLAYQKNHKILLSLDLDSPTIKLLGSPQIDLEEGKDSLVLRCEADANPPASIVWRRAGRSEIASLTESLQLRPVSRRDSGENRITKSHSRIDNQFLHRIVHMPSSKLCGNKRCFIRTIGHQM